MHKALDAVGGKKEPVVILGSTGSIGRSAVDILRAQPGGFRVVGLAAGSVSETFLGQIREFRPNCAAVGDQREARRLRDSGIIKELGGKPKILHGEKGLEYLASMPGVKKVLNAVCGNVGILPSIAAVSSGKTLLLANKEALVSAGKLITAAAKKYGGEILPVDSEHSAIFQCLQAENHRAIGKIILTASGGPFFNKKNHGKITPKMALKHPKWKMGKKITIDSATLMNKGMEIIETSWLFGVPVGKIEILIHPECIIHSMVEFIDGVILAQMSVPDMRIPINYALNYPVRIASDYSVPVDFRKVSRLNFHSLDISKYPCVELAVEAARAGGLLPTVLSAADEVAVDAFLGERIGFDDIPGIIDCALNWAKDTIAGERVTLESILEADRSARLKAGEAVGAR
jgi:1-deoxy-D-xylulose-5-phosphate reductoisomerase